jgi:hypothetical protein
MFLSLAFPNLVFPSAILKVTPQGPMPQRPGAPRGEAALNSCSVPRSISRRPLPVPGFGRQGSQTFQIRAWAPIVFGLYSRVIHSGWDRPAVQGAVRREVTPSLSRRQGDRQSYKGVGYSSHIRPHNSPRHVRPSHVPRSHVPRSIGRRHMAAVTWPPSHGRRHMACRRALLRRSLPVARRSPKASTQLCPRRFSALQCGPFCGKRERCGTNGAKFVHQPVDTDHG